jgi:hypothetical protein
MRETPSTSCFSLCHRTLLAHLRAIGGPRRWLTIKLDVVTEVMRERLRAVAVALDPLRLLGEIRGMQCHLVQRAVGATAHTAPPRDANLESFLKSLATVWRGGGAADASEGGEATARLENPSRPLRERMAAGRDLARSRARPNREGAPSCASKWRGRTPSLTVNFERSNAR